LIEVPSTLNGYDLTGTKLWFRFAASAMVPIPQILSSNGRRVAHGRDLNQFLLDPVKQEIESWIAVKLLQTVDRNASKTPRSASSIVGHAASPLDLLCRKIEAVWALTSFPGAQSHRRFRRGWKAEPQASTPRSDAKTASLTHLSNAHVAQLTGNSGLGRVPTNSRGPRRLRSVLVAV